MQPRKCELHFSPHSGVHSIGPKLLKQNYWDCFVHNDNILNDDENIHIVSNLEEAMNILNELIDKRNKILESVNPEDSCKKWILSKKEMKRIQYSFKTFWRCGHANSTFDCETGANPIELMSRVLRLVSFDPLNNFGRLCSSLLSATDPREGGTCLQGYTVRLLVDFGDYTYYEAKKKLKTEKDNLSSDA